MKKRIVYFDVLKIVTCFMVVLIHVISRTWYTLDLKSNEFIFLTILDSICRCAVPIYLMISGAIFLNEDKDITIKDILKKYILNIFLIYLFWNILYSVVNIVVNNKTLNIDIIKNIFVSTILGNGVFHLKFLVTIIGFYLCVPFIRCITKKENKKILQYLIILLFIFTCVPSVLNILNINLKYPILFSGFTLYFILGYYLNKFEINKKYRYIIYILGLISLIITPVLTINDSINNSIYSEKYFYYGSFNVYLYSASLFLLFKNVFDKTKETKLLNNLSKLYFGVYLIHGLVLGLLMKFNIFGLSLNLSIKTLVISCLVFFISLIVSFILSKIPFIKKLIYVK